MPQFRTLREEKKFEAYGTIALPDVLQKMYDGDLRFPPLPQLELPYVLLNFVTSIDGIASFGIPLQSGGGNVSMFNKEDAALMGMLRGACDAVAVASGTLKEEREHKWTPQYIADASEQPEIATEMYAWRQKQGKPKNPLNIIFSRSGDVDLSAPVFCDPEIGSVIVTSSHTKLSLVDKPSGCHASIVVIESDESKFNVRALAALRAMNVRYLLVEGGPRWAGTLMRDKCIDEYFRTEAPQIIGSGTEELPRKTVMTGVAFTPETAPRFEVISKKEDAETGNYTFFRYKRI